jgi:Family of unknown function (DUF5329)
MPRNQDAPMNTRSIRWALPIVALLGLPAARAETPVPVQNEVNYLLGYIAGSGCEFYRNGTWYHSQKAQVHLRDKYKFLVEKNLADTTEHFIERAASESSASGKPYQIRCSDGVAVPSQQWLREKLVQLREQP